MIARWTKMVALASLVTGSPMLGQTASRQACDAANPALAVGASFVYPGLGHLYIARGERRRGTVLLATATAGSLAVLAAIVVPPITRSDAAFTSTLVAGVSAYEISNLASIIDVVPALVRDRRRCARGDHRMSMVIRPNRPTLASPARLAGGFQLVARIDY